MNIALIGYGKMGKEIEKILLSRGHKIPLIIDINNASELTAENLAKADVAIEFTAPDSAYANIVACLKAGTPVVCGTTAWLEHYDQVADLCKKNDGTFFYSSNYSIGVNIFFEVNKLLARLMNRYEEYDVTIEETHHTQKKDAPSGTAITIAEGILEGIERKQKWVCGTTTESQELEIAAIRRSVIPGTHTVTYESGIDMITMTHLAKNRIGLAMGAVLAAEYILGKKGIYTMEDLMKL